MMMMSRWTKEPGQIAIVNSRAWDPESADSYTCLCVNVECEVIVTEQKIFFILDVQLHDK